MPHRWAAVGDNPRVRRLSGPWSSTLALTGLPVASGIERSLPPHAAIAEHDAALERGLPPLPVARWHFQA